MKYALFLLFLTFLAACQRHYPVTPESSYTDTRWYYNDGDKEFEMLFLEDGTFTHTIEADRTPGNEFWYEKNGKLHFVMNDGYARYTGVRKDSNQVAGTAKNKKKKTWGWQMTIMN